MNLLSRILIPLVILPLACVNAAPADEKLEDRFSYRWFDIEIIVFERLPVLDATTNEQLTSTRTRQWPRNLLEMGPVSGATSSLFDYALDRCYASDHDESRLARQLGLERNTFTDESLSELASSASLNQTIDSNSQDEEDENQGEDGQDRDQADPLLDEQILPEPDPDTLFDALIADYEQQLLNESFQWRDDLTLINAVKAINRQRDLRPVLHLRWRQPVPERAQPAPVWVRAPVTIDAPATRAGLPKIEGHIAVTVGRYLHFAPTLWYNSDTAGLAPVPFPPPAFLQAIPAQTGYMALSESRRMRSEELHYLDHPKFGVIVRIDPVPIPDRIQAAWEALQNDVVSADATELSN
jgi:hypothetical protein